MARTAFDHELGQLRLQVELLAVRVADSISRMQRVLATGDADVAAEAVAADDDIDATMVSLTERTCELIRREAPVATDLRLLISVLRVLEDFERIGDLCLRVVKQVDVHPLFARHPRVLALLETMAGLTAQLYGDAIDAWAAQDVANIEELVNGRAVVAKRYEELVDELHALQGPDATKVAVAAVLVSRALDRIADHTVIVGERLRYLVTGDPAYLAAEVR